jgi:hypothetical protein
MMMKMNILNIGFIALILIATLNSDLVSAKSSCDKYAHKVNQQQAKQRFGYSAKQGQKLDRQLDSARELWRRCENTPDASQKKKRKRVTTVNKQGTIDNSQPLTLPQSTSRHTSSPFATSNAIVLSNKYQGNKLAQWQRFYQRPQQCARPKTTQIFAACLADREQQQTAFEQQYQP